MQLFAAARAKVLISTFNGMAVPPLLVADAWFQPLDGSEVQYLTRQFTPTNTVRAREEFLLDGEVTKDSICVGMKVGTQLPLTSRPNRGQLYCLVELRPQRQTLGQGYITENKAVNLGEYVESTSGRGHLRITTLADDIAPIDVSHALAIANTRRKIYGFIWYYNASADAANRTQIVTIDTLLGALPTGFASVRRSASWVLPTNTLTADQEGFVTALKMGGGSGRALISVNSTDTIVDITTDPLPFPLLVHEDDTGNLEFDVGAANANDRHTIYLLEEQWIEL